MRSPSESWLRPNEKGTDTKTKLISILFVLLLSCLVSISIYNAKGYFKKNQYNAYSLNNITAKKGADGSIDIQFGGCDGKIPNCLPIIPEWNYIVRLYRSPTRDFEWRMEIFGGAACIMI